jgi:cytochrome P450
MTLLDRYTATIELSSFDEIREALFDPNLSRTFDRRSYHEGNIREGIVSIQQGAVHRARRRVENSQFRPERLREYERDLFPAAMTTILDEVMTGDEADLYPIGELLACVLATRRAGLDVDGADIATYRHLVEVVDAFSQGSAILDAKDPDAVRALVYATYEAFERDFIAPARARREALLARRDAGTLGDDEVPHDILTVLLEHLHDPALELDEGRLVREVATYLQGGTHTSGQVAVNAIDLIFATDMAMLDRVAEDRLFAQRVAHETLRLRPTTPRIRRRAEADTVVAGKAIPRDSLVILDAVAGNRDPKYFGDTADRFDPDRTVDSGAPRWGLSFGAGPHQCPGRTVGGGFPVDASFEAEPGHLFGLVSMMLQAWAQRGVLPHPDRVPVPDTRTDRYTRWAHYWVRLGAPRGPRAAR